MLIHQTRTTIVFAVSLSLGVAHALPSQRYDDYDLERYERLVQDASTALQAAQSDLERIKKDSTIAEADLRANENEISSRTEQARTASASIAASDEDLRQLRSNVPQFQRNIQIGEQQVQQMRGEIQNAKVTLAREERQREPSLNRLNQARAHLEQLQRQLQGLQQAHRQAEAQAARTEQRAHELEKKMNEFRQGVTNYGNVVQGRRREVDQARQEIASYPARRKALEAENALYQPEWDNLLVREPQLKESLRTLDREISELERAGNTEGAQAKRQEREGKQAELNHAQYRQSEIKNLWVRNNQRIEQIDREVAALEKKITDLNANIRILEETAVFYAQEADKLAPQVAEAKRQLQSQRDQVAQASAAMNPVAQQVSTQEGVVSVAQREFDGANNQYLIADRHLRRLDKEFDRVVTVLEQNRSGLQETLVRIRDLARSNQEARLVLAQIDRELLTLQTQREALSRRLNSADQAVNGAENRLNAAVTRRREMEAALDRVEQNLKDAQIEISEVARSHGTADGAKEGDEFGLAKGNQEGLEKGKIAGLEEALKLGREAGSLAKNDTVAMNQGLTTGRAEGVAQAIEQAKPFEKMGFEQKEREFLEAQLKEVTLSNGFRGLQQATRRSEHGDGRYYKPRPGQYPHPKLTVFYTEAYDGAYRSSLSAAYRETYAETYTAVFKKTLDQFKADKVKYAEGFRIGNREASLLKGLEDGRTLGFSENIDKEKLAATSKGTARANAKYAEPVIQIVGAKLREVSDDGVLAPGEDAIVEVQVKNFGSKDKVGLRGLMSLNGRGISVPTADMALPPISAKSAVTIRMAQRLSIGASTSVGTQFTAQFKVADGGQTLMNTSFTGAVQTPVQVTIRQAPRLLVPGTASALEVTITNVTNKEQLVALQIAASAQQVQISQNTQSLKIPSGSSASARFELAAQEAALFETAPLQVIATQSGAKLTEPTQLSVLIGRPFQLRSSSQGILIGQDLSGAESKALREGMTLDSYDIRVNGSMPASALSGVGTKPLHIAVEQSGSAIDNSTAQTLLSHLNQGGIVVIWGQASSDSLPSGLLRVSGISQARAIKSTQASGTDILEGLAISGVNSESAILTLTGNATSVLSSGTDVIGSLAMTNEFSDQPGRVVVLGLQPSALSAAMLARASQMIEASGPSFTAKMAQAQRSADALRSVALDMLAEIRSDDARPDVRWIGGDKKRDGKIMRVTRGLLKNQKEIARHYPALRQAAESMTDQRDRSDTLKLINDDLRKTFCKSFRTEDRWAYCK